MNLAMLLDMAADGFGDREAVRCGSVVLRYDELRSAARAAAAIFAASGCQHAALLDETSPAVPIALFASAWAGVPFVPLSYRLADAEVDALLDRVVPVQLVTDAVRAKRLADRDGVATLTRHALLGVRDDGDAPIAFAEDGDAIAILLFTSGTTGVPKAAVLRHRHLVAYILGSVEFGAAGEEEATLVAVPPYHIAGMAAVLSSVYAGRRIVQLPQFDARAWIDLARSERVTHAFVVPTMLARIVAALEAEPVALPALRALSYGGGKMPLPVIERALRLLPQVAFTNAYGLTETSSTIALLGPEDHRAAFASDDPALRRRLASAGLPLPGVEVEVRDADGKHVAPGTHGEVHVRGEQVAGEYLGRDALGSDGFFPTRDAGFVDADGYLFLEGRLDDVIVRGGENLSPGEIEDVLREHPDVADCAVFGVPDEQWGEAVAAAIVPHPGVTPSADDLRDFVRARLRSSRAPERIAFRDALPYTETGKLLRRVVKADLLGETPP